jgi:hypothetical protein
MKKAVGGLVRRILGLLLLVAAAYGGWRFGDYVFPPLEARLGLDSGPVLAVDGVEPDAALAQATGDRIDQFLSGDGGELELSGVELTSLLRHGAQGEVPDGISNPTVRLVEGRAEVSADVSVADFPGLPDLGPIAGMLPDTVTVQVKGSVIGFGDGEAILFVQGLEIEGLPLPRGLIPEMMSGLGRIHRPGLPAEAVAVALPDGVSSAYVTGDRLVVVADR